MDAEPTERPLQDRRLQHGDRPRSTGKGGWRDEGAPGDGSGRLPLSRGDTLPPRPQGRSRAARRLGAREAAGWAVRGLEVSTQAARWPLDHLPRSQGPRGRGWPGWAAPGGCGPGNGATAHRSLRGGVWPHGRRARARHARRADTSPVLVPGLSPGTWLPLAPRTCSGPHDQLRPLSCCVSPRSFRRRPSLLLPEAPRAPLPLQDVRLAAGLGLGLTHPRPHGQGSGPSVCLSLPGPRTPTWHVRARGTATRCWRPPPWQLRLRLPPSPNACRSSFREGRGLQRAPLPA